MPQVLVQIIRVLKWILIAGVLVSAARLYRTSASYCLNSAEDFEPKAAQHCGVDMDQYVDNSNNLLEGRGFAAQFQSNLYGMIFSEGDELIYETNRLPGFPLLLSGLRWLYPAQESLHLFNLLCGLVIVVSSGLLTGAYLGSIPALIACIWLLNNGQVQPWIFGGNSDIVAAAAVTSFCLVLFRARDTGFTLLALFALGVFGVFLRSNTFLLFLPLLAGASLVFRRPRLIYPLVAILICLGGWCLRNYAVSGRATVSTMSGKQLFLEYPGADNTSAEFQWYFWYDGPQHDTIKALRGGMSVNEAWAKTDLELGRLAKAWILANPAAAGERFWIAWTRLMDIQTDGWFKTPFEIFAAPVKTALYAIWLILSLGLALVRFKRGRESVDGVLLVLTTATLLFLGVTNFWHGDWVSIRGSLVVLPALFTILFYPVLLALREIRWNAT